MPRLTGSMDRNALKKILILAAYVSPSESLNLDREQHELERGLQRTPQGDRFEILTEQAFHPDDWRRALLDNEPHIVHFLGRGLEIDGLAFEEKGARIRLVNAASLGHLFESFRSRIECVLLDGCYSKIQAEAIARHIPYTIGIDRGIGDRVAVNFAVNFYDEIGSGRSIEKAYDFACQAIADRGISRESIPLFKRQERPFSNSGDRRAVSDASQAGKVQNIPASGSLMSLAHSSTLAAIVFTDVVDSTEHMVANERQTLELLDRDLSFIREVAQCFDGRVLKSMGDGLLLYFDSAVKAVACAQKIQIAFNKVANKLPRDRVLQHRIGIHVGEVFFSGNDVLGTGVNVAARLQGKARPGGICLSQIVYQVVCRHLDLKIECIGSQYLKGIPDAIILYQINP
jgi:class 3 adenylate cyclase